MNSAKHHWKLKEDCEKKVSFTLIVGGISMTNMSTLTTKKSISNNDLNFDS